LRRASTTRRSRHRRRAGDLRRARPVPRSIETAGLVEPILATGGPKNTFCIAAGNTAFVVPHIGDLETVATLRAYETSIR
jgi:hydrogenase maturation protein HypF